MLTEHVADADAVPWRRGETEGLPFECQVLLDGADGGPEALRFRFDPALSVYAHMHLVSQFQLLIGGAMDLPKPGMKLRPVAVHYTDHNLPYGPFSVADGHEVLVLHPRQGGLVTMKDREARRQIHLGGRELSGMAKDVQWQRLPGAAGLRGKTLISGRGPEVVIVECPAGATIGGEAAPFGRYEVVLEGSVEAGSSTLTRASLRYVVGDDAPSPLRAGPRGATVALLTFDADALAGGVTGEGIGAAAGEAMARIVAAI
jgi:hypothetical protein